MDIFFNKLSERKYNENDLSDFTWAICYQNKEFNNFFVSYCFPNEKFTNINKFEREFRKSKSRPDFHFYNDNTEYLLEIKIYDKNQHFVQYSKSFPKAKKSFLANYNLSEKINGYSLVTWRNLILKLEKEIKINKILNTDLIIGYLKYLKNVTNFYEETIMKFSNLNSLPTFYKITVDILEDKFHDKVKIDKRSKSIDCDYYGLNLTNKKKNSKYFYLWVGLAFHNVNVELAFQIHDCSKDRISNLKKGEYFTIKEDNNWIILKENYFKELCTSNNISKQKDILEKYYIEVLGKLI